MTEREIFKKYANLSENELNTKNNKEVYAKDDVKKNRCIQIKTDNSRMSRTRRQIKNRKNVCEEKILEEYYVNIYEIDPYFYGHYKENKKNK